MHKHAGLGRVGVQLQATDALACAMATGCFPNIVWDIASRPEWSVRLVGAHPAWSAPASRGCCSSLTPAAALHHHAEPHHLTLYNLGLASRLPYMSSDECVSSAGVSWLGDGAREPRSVIGFWGWPPPTSGSLGPIAVTETGALYSPRLDVLYSQHPEYHAPPPCNGPAAEALLALRDGGEAAAAGLRSCRSAVVVMQAYAASYWHLLLEVAPRLLMALPLLRGAGAGASDGAGGGGGGGVGDSGCKLIAPRTAASLELFRLLGVSDDAVLAVPPGGAVLVRERLAFATTSPFSWHSLPPRRWIVDVRAAVLAAATAAAAQATATATRSSADAAGAAASADETMISVGGGGGGGGGGAGADADASVVASCDEVVVFSLRAAREATGLDEARKLLDAHFADRAVVVGGEGEEPRLCSAAVHADDLPLTQQIRLFGATTAERSVRGSGSGGGGGGGGGSGGGSGAPRLRAIVGSHGANLVHALWAAPPCAIVEIVPPPPRPAFANYQHLAAALGLDHFVVPARAGDATGGDGGGFAVEPDLVLRVVLDAIGLASDAVSSAC